MSSKYQVIAFIFLFVCMLFVLHFISTIYQRVKKKEAYRNIENFSNPSNTSSLDPRIQIIDAVDSETMTESEKTTLLQKAFKRFENLKEATPQGIKDFIRSSVPKRNRPDTGGAVSDPKPAMPAMPAMPDVQGVRDSSSHSADMTAVMSKVSTLTEQSAALMKTVNEMKALAMFADALPPVILPHHRLIQHPINSTVDDSSAPVSRLHPADAVDPVDPVSSIGRFDLGTPGTPLSDGGDGKAPDAFRTLASPTQAFVERVEAFENVGHRGAYAMYTDEK